MMYKTTFYPLRSCVGEAAEIKEIVAIDRSPTYQTQEIEFNWVNHPDSQSTVQQEVYRDFLPTINLGGTISRHVSGNRLPLDVPPAFSATTPAASLYALASKTKQNEVSRELNLTLQIKLKKKSDIGGICFRGFPFLPFRCESHGENSSNFGIPREIRVTAISTVKDGLKASRQHDFLDADISTTRQQIVSHSGFHYLAIDRTTTDTLLLFLSDFPQFLTGIKIDDSRQPPLMATKVNYGFILPQLYVYTYQETTRYRPPVPFGLLGLRQNDENKPDIDNPPGSATNDLTDYHSLNLQHLLREAQDYADFTAASLFTQERQFNFGRSSYHEAFISPALRPQESIVLYCEQAEDNRRCVAGLKVLAPFIPESNLDTDIQSLADQWSTLFPHSPLDLNMISSLPRELLEDILRAYVLRIPRDIDFCEKLRIRVFELDPIDGVSPMNVPLSGKHARVLADVQIDELSEALWTYFKGLRFRNSSTASYFAIEITNVDDKPGQVVLKSLDFIQSAHVSLRPRASRKQNIMRLRFRLIGQHLAEDYADLGEHGFNFSVERQLAGQRKVEIFKANSLLDLVEEGNAKLLTNTRQRAVEDQQSQVLGGAKDNYSQGHSEARTEGWRKSETGYDVELPAYLTQDDDEPGPLESYSNLQTRQHTEVLSPIEENNDWRSAALIGNVLYTAWESGTTANLFTNAFADSGNLLEASEQTFLGPNSTLIPTYEFNKLYHGFDKAWRGLEDPHQLKVQGMTTVNSSPFGYNNVSKDILDLLDAFSSGDPATIGANAADLLVPGILQWSSKGMLNIYSFAAMNSLGLSLSVQPVGLGITLSTSTGGGLLLPSYSHINSFGTQGTIQHSATETGYAYDNRLVNSRETQASTTFTDDAASHRRTTRKEVANTQTQRIRGAEILWQNELVDIVTGSINLDIQLPAISDETHYGNLDDAIHVRIGSGVNEDIKVDFWFDILEEVVQDDY